MKTLALLLLAAPAWSAFEDADLTPRTAALGSAFTGAAEGAAGLPFNPAGVASQRKPEFFLGFLRLRELAAGSTDRTDAAAALAVPMPLGPTGGLGLLWRREETKNLSEDKRLYGAWGRRGVWESGEGRVDVGAGLGLLMRDSIVGAKAKSAPTFDVGALLYYGSRYRAGVSLLNLTNPDMSLGTFQDRAPRALKVGVARSLPFWSLTIDATQRASSALGAGGLTVAAGLEHWWNRADLGALAARGGMAVGGAGKVFGTGLSLQRGGAELQYALQLPLDGGPAGHSLAFAFYFGGREPRDVYQQLLRQERDAREDLHRMIESQEELLAKLRQDLMNSRIEVEKLKVELESRPADKEKSDEKLKWLLELQSDLKRDLQAAETQRKAIQTKRKEPSFETDWAEYEKLKAGGAPSHVLAESLRGLIERYRGTSADLSSAYGELLKVQETR